MRKYLHTSSNMTSCHWVIHNPRIRLHNSSWQSSPISRLYPFNKLKARPKLFNLLKNYKTSTKNKLYYADLWIFYKMSPLRLGTLFTKNNLNLTLFNNLYESKSKNWHKRMTRWTTFNENWEWTKTQLTTSSCNSKLLKISTNMQDKTFN